MASLSEINCGVIVCLLVSRQEQQDEEAPVIFSSTMDDYVDRSRNERSKKISQEIDDDSSIESNRNFGHGGPMHPLNMALQSEDHQVNVDQATFPSIDAMQYHNYVSDAQRARSDVATVCSGSILEDIEVESVLSQEEIDGTSKIQLQELQHQQLQDDGTTSFYDEYHSRPSLMIPDKKSSPRLETTESDYGFAKIEEIQSAHLHKDSNSERNRTDTKHLDEVYEPFATDRKVSSLSSVALMLLSENSSNTHGMGPPLSRSWGVSASHHHGSDSGSLQECETRSNVSSTCIHDYEPPSALNVSGSGLKGTEEFDETAVEKVIRLRLQDSHSQSGSVKSYGSFNTGADTDDCGCSLDVETHSIETKSIHSQDDVTMLVTDNATTTSSAPTAASASRSADTITIATSSANGGHEDTEIAKDRLQNTNTNVMQGLRENDVQEASVNIELPNIQETDHRWPFTHHVPHVYDPRQSIDEIVRSHREKGICEGVKNKNSDRYQKSENKHLRGRRLEGVETEDAEECKRVRDRSRSRDREDEKMTPDTRSNQHSYYRKSDDGDEDPYHDL
jgi:hypothetical protein